MNIDSSSLSSLFSSTESLEGLQQTLQLEGEIPEEFANMLMQKLTQLKNLDMGSASHLMSENTEGGLHGLADFSSIFGNNLPVLSKLEGEIDLEDTLHALEDVMHTLEELVDQEKTLGEGLVEDITVEGSEQLELNLDEMSDDPLSLLESNKQILSQQKQQVDDDKALRESLLENQNELNEELLVTNQLAAVSEIVDEPKNKEAKILLASGQVLETINKKDVSLFKTMTAESAALAAENEENERLLSEDKALGKTGLDPSIVAEKQNQKIKILEMTDFELPKEKITPKFAMDIANLNRAVMPENKVEIPPMTKHFAHPEWNKEVGERVIWMHKQQIPSAELRLNPRHLGPITIKIDVSQDQANVSFIAQHAAVKEAIESAIPKLREMFLAQQLNLAEVNVSQEDSSQKQSRAFDQMGNGSDQGNKNSREAMANEEQQHTMDIAEEIEMGRAIATNGVLSIFA